MNEELTRSLLKQLTKQEQVILADFWESDTRKVFEKLFGTRQLQIAQLVLKGSADHYYTVENRGRANELKTIIDMLHENFKKVNAKRVQ